MKEPIDREQLILSLRKPSQPTSSDTLTLRVSVKLEKIIVNRSRKTATQRCVMLCGLILIVCSAGCACSGTMQPHQAFRQTTTPYQAYYQGQQPANGQFGYGGSFDTATAADYAGYGGYNNSLPGQGQPYGLPALGSNGMFGTPAGYGAAYGQYAPVAPAAGYNDQPTYSGGFSSGSC